MNSPKRKPRLTWASEGGVFCTLSTAFVLGAACFLALLTGCLGDDFSVGGNDVDGSTDVPRDDASTPRADSSTPRADSSTPRADSSTPRADSATPRADSSTPRADSSTPRADSSTPRGDAAVDAPPPVCEARPLPCLPEGTDRLVEVTSYDDIEGAAAGTILQVRGLKLGRTHLPPYTTLHGCEGAELNSLLTFDGAAGTLEGMLITGYVGATQTGNYIVRANEFRTTSPDGALVATARASLGQDVVMEVDSNLFIGGAVGIVASTRYHNMSRTVDIHIQNNIFDGVDQPIRLSETGLTGETSAVVEFNTFVGFETAVSLFGLDSSVSTVRANLFAGGETGLSSNVAYAAPFNMGWDLTTPIDGDPTSGELVVIPESFVGPNDYRLRRASLAVDAAGSIGPESDYQGCLRPMGGGVDVGAHESH